MKKFDVSGEKWGFLKESCKDAEFAAIDEDTNLKCTGLDDYLKVIYPEIDDWVHNRKVPNKDVCRKPDYRSETKQLIIEFDGLFHYIKPNAWDYDQETDRLYKSWGYDVIRIPYFIQLTNQVVKQLFHVDVEERLFNDNIPSLGKDANPADLPGYGLYRMAKEFKTFPEQYKINLEYLKSFDENDVDYKHVLMGAKALEAMYNGLGNNDT